MLFCHCNGVSEAKVAAELAAGVGSVRELCARTGIGTGCGSCLIAARLLLKQRAASGEVRVAGDARDASLNPA
jgi:bacterioferritin-associated ferredoxin